MYIDEIGTNGHIDEINPEDTGLITCGRTATTTSGNVVIKVVELTHEGVIGAVQKFSYHENANCKVYGNCERIIFDRLNILQAFTGQRIYSKAKEVQIGVELIYSYGVRLLFPRFKITNYSSSICTATQVIIETINFESEAIQDLTADA